jgi:antitoxin component YwqK of YwqJK toxin-antitoxin module
LGLPFGYHYKKDSNSTTKELISETKIKGQVLHYYSNGAIKSLTRMKFVKIASYKLNKYYYENGKIESNWKIKYRRSGRDRSVLKTYNKEGKLTKIVKSNYIWQKFEIQTRHHPEGKKKTKARMY